jgi:hypothetical protein
MELYSLATQWYWFNEPFFLNSFDIGSERYSSIAQPTVIDLHAESNGKIPRSIGAICLQLGARDSNSSTANCWVNLYRAPSSLYVLQRNIGTYNQAGPALPNDTWSQEQGIVPCDENGNIAFRCGASGDKTLDISLIAVGFAGCVTSAPNPPTLT